MPSFTSKWNRTNVSFSGCDIVATVSITLSGGQKITKTIGSLQTLTYSIHMDKHPVRSFGNVNAKDYVFGPRTIAGTLIFAVFNKHFAQEILDEAAVKGDLGGNYQILMDELPAFDITVSFANEYGAKARLALYGVRIINEGQTMSVNDIYTENTYQFVATDIEYMSDANSSSGRHRSGVADSVIGVVTDDPYTNIIAAPSSQRNSSGNTIYNSKVEDGNIKIQRVEP